MRKPWVTVERLDAGLPVGAAGIRVTERRLNPGRSAKASKVPGLGLDVLENAFGSRLPAQP